MSNALESARTHLAELREELAAATLAGLADHPAYQADLREEMEQAHVAYTAAAVERDRVVPRAAERPAGRLARRELARDQREPARRCRRGRSPARPRGRSRSAVSSRWRSFTPSTGLLADRDDEVLGPHARARRGRAVRSPRRPRRRAARPSAAATAGGSGRAPPAMPIQARRTRPSRISAATICAVVALTGTARPSPTPATAVLMPTTRPRPSTSAPPELPGFSAASVWITSSTTRIVASGARRERAAERGDDPGGDRALEAVRVADRDHELADAQVAPRRRAARGRAPARRRAARRGRRAGRRRPGRSASSRPSVNEARTRPPPLPTTCAEVSRKPSGVITTPEPPPAARPRRRRAGSPPTARPTRRRTSRRASRRRALRLRRAPSLGHLPNDSDSRADATRRLGVLYLHACKQQLQPRNNSPTCWASSPRTSTARRPRTCSACWASSGCPSRR